MSTDHQLSKSEKERLWIREQLGQLPELRQSIDTLFQHLAALCRHLKISPEEIVASTKDFPANYTFLMDCMKEEQRLNREMQEANKLKSQPSDETKQAIDHLSINQEENAKKEESRDDGSAS